METVFRKFSAAMTTLSCALGDHLGLFQALAAGSPATSADLATRTGTDERCLKQWLSALAAAEYIQYEPRGQVFSLPAEHAALLADEGGMMCLSRRIATVARFCWSGGQDHRMLLHWVRCSAGRIRSELAGRNGSHECSLVRKPFDSNSGCRPFPHSEPS
jgi:hypothetical protein